MGQTSDKKRHHFFKHFNWKNYQLTSVWWEKLTIPDHIQWRHTDWVEFRIFRIHHRWTSILALTTTLLRLTYAKQTTRRKCSRTYVYIYKYRVQNSSVLSVWKSCAALWFVVVLLPQYLHIVAVTLLLGSVTFDLTHHSPHAADRNNWMCDEYEEGYAITGWEGENSSRFRQGVKITSLKLMQAWINFFTSTTYPTVNPLS